jgi:hypothetical protein
VKNNGSQATRKTGQTKSLRSARWINAPRRFTGVQPHWRRYWNDTYRRYMYADPDCDCTYYSAGGVETSTNHAKNWGTRTGNGAIHHCTT